MITYTNARYTDFFSFFNLTEIKRQIIDDDTTLIHLKPGGFQEHIDISFVIDPDEFIKESKLWLTRTWIGDDKQLNVFAKDIAKSFINDLVDEESAAGVADIVKTLYNVRGANDHIISISGESAPTLQDLEVPELREMVETFCGIRELWQCKISDISLKLENRERKDQQQLLIELRYGK